MNLYKTSTLALALVLVLAGWVACSSTNNTDVASIGSGGAIATGGVSGSGGAGIDAAGGMGGAVADASVDGPSISPPDGASDMVTGTDVPAVTPNDGGPTVDICTGLTVDQCHVAIINAPVPSTVSALDPGPNPPITYPSCSAM